MLKVINPSFCIQMVVVLSSIVYNDQAALLASSKQFEGFSFLWQDDITTHYTKFLAQEPTLQVRVVSRFKENAGVRRILWTRWSNLVGVSIIGRRVKYAREALDGTMGCGPSQSKENGLL